MKTTFLNALFGLLNQRIPYAVLRNHEGLPAECSSRDIDILITRKDLRGLKRALREIAARNNCRELYHFQDNQFWSVVYVDEAQTAFQLDFQYNFAWLGIDLLDENFVLSKRVFNGKVYHLPPDFTFLPKYLYSRILGAKYPEKYAEVRRAALEYGGQGIEKILCGLAWQGA